jgi:sugar phosphate isomerase/epimerase
MNDSQTNKLNIAFQTWTVQPQLRANTESVLRQIRAIGFKHLELAGNAGKSPEEFSRLCAEHGLGVMGIHQPAVNSEGLQDWLAEVRRNYHAHAVKHVTVMLDPMDRADPDAYREYAELCSRAGQVLKREGVTLSYHCYHFDLLGIDDAPDSKSGLDILMEHTSEEHLGFQLDVHFIYKAGIEHEIVLRKCGSRCKLIHLCDTDSEGNRATIGQGIIDWKQLIPDLQKYCDLEWLIIENRGRDVLSSAEQGLCYLRECLSPARLI